jgi:predicted nucleic-acid-binding protein
MIGGEMNVLLRIFTNDNPTQTEATLALLEAQGPGGVRVDRLVLAELVWTLVRQYKRDRSQIASIIEELLAREELDIDDRDVAMTALERFRRSKADFADHLIAAANDRHGAAPTYTFDQDAAATRSFRLVGS